MCNKEVHEILIQEGQVNCIFCNERIQDPGKPERDFCCDSMRLIKDNFLVCKNCGQVHDYFVDRLGKLPSKEQQFSRTQHFILRAYVAIFVLHIQYGPRGTPLTPMIQRQNCLLSTI